MFRSQTYSKVNQTAKWMISLALMISVMVGFVGSAAAQEPDSSAEPEPLHLQRRLISIVLDVVGKATGLDQRTLWEQLGGQSVSELLQAQGIDPQTVMADVKTVVSAEIEQAVADGTLTRQRADRLLNRLDNRLEQVFNANRPATFGHKLQIRGWNQLVRILGEQSGLTLHEIRQATREGQTLADIANAHGIDPNAVSAEALRRTTDILLAAVAEGQITQEQMDAMLQEATAFYNEAMSQPLPEVAEPIRDRLEQWIGKSVIGVTAEMAGAEPRIILQEWRDGESLVQVIEAHGLTVDAVLTEVEAKITERANSAVSAGKITQEKADELLAQLHERLLEHINGPFPLQRSPLGIRNT